MPEPTKLQSTVTRGTAISGEAVAGGIGSGVLLVWINNTLLPAIPYLDWWPSMSAEVAVALAPVLLAIVERLLERLDG